MKPDQITFFNKTNTGLAVDLVLKVGAYSANRTSSRTGLGKSKSNIFQTIESNPKKHNKSPKESKIEGKCLKIEVIKKMLSKFLLEKNMEKGELAKNLNITSKELEKLLLHEKVGVGLINKVNLPLIKLFCKTKFNN